MDSSQIQDAIIHKLEAGPCPPTDLLKALIEQGFAESEIRKTVSQLLNERVIELTGQQVLQKQAA